MSRLTTSSTSPAGLRLGRSAQLRVDGDEVGLLADLERADGIAEAQRLALRRASPGAATRAGPAPVSRRASIVDRAFWARKPARICATTESSGAPATSVPNPIADARRLVARQGHDAAADEHVADRAMGDGRAALGQPGDLALGEVDGVREEGPGAQAAGAVVDIEVVERLRELLGDRGHLVPVLGEVRLPGRPVVSGQGCRLAEQVRRAGDREARREGVAQATVRSAVPALAEVRRLAQARLEDRVARQSVVVA